MLGLHDPPRGTHADDFTPPSHCPRCNSYVSVSNEFEYRCGSYWGARSGMIVHFVMAVWSCATYLSGKPMPQLCRHAEGA